MSTRRSLHLLTVLAVCLSCTPEASAHPRAASAAYVTTVEDESGRELRTFHHDGQTFVLGTYGERYNIRVQNHTGRRVEAVISVDGRDVVSGKIGDFVHERGYLIEAYGDVLIEGFRQSTQDVAAFRFTSPGDSYSAQMGTPQNVGVIGVAVFPERVRPIPLRTRPQHLAPPRPDYYGRRDASNREGAGMGTTGPAAKGKLENGYRRSPSSAAEYDGLGDMARSGGSERRASSGQAYAPAAPEPSRDNLGTEYGESVSSWVEEMPFERASATSPASVITLRYDDREGLIARGIEVDPVYRAYRPYRRPCGPDAFPANGFAPPPCRD